jgi:hypothetical protein
VTADDSNPALKYLSDARVFRWNGIDIEVGDDSLWIPSWDRKLPLPQKRNRGRDVGVLAVWQGTKTGSLLTYDPRLASAAAICDSNTQAIRRLKDLLGSHHRATYWRRNVTSGLAVDPRLDDAASRIGLVNSHSPGAGPDYVATDAHRSVIDVHEQRCGACHRSAVAIWSGSQHARSMTTLRNKARDFDPRCLSCHSYEYKVHEHGGTAIAGHDAVTCMSCHKKSNPRDACVECHTFLTDPRQSYLRHIDSICAGPQDDIGKTPCERE